MSNEGRIATWDEREPEIFLGRRRDDGDRRQGDRRQGDRRQGDRRRGERLAGGVPLGRASRPERRSG